MSTIDPRRRMLRRSWFLPALRGTLWALSGISVFVIALVIAALPSNRGAWALGFAAVPILLVVAVEITDANTRNSARRAAYPLPFLLWMLGLWAACGGAGLLLGRVWMLGAMLLLAGAGLMVGAVRLLRRNKTIAARARRIELTGSLARATVTEVTRNRGDDTVPLWNVTVRFRDTQGVDRWHRIVHHSKVPVGSRHSIRYDPKKPGRRSTLFVEWGGRGY